MRGSREISLVPSLHRASTDALMNKETQDTSVHVSYPLVVSTIILIVLVLTA